MNEEIKTELHNLVMEKYDKYLYILHVFDRLIGVPEKDFNKYWKEIKPRNILMQGKLQKRGIKNFIYHQNMEDWTDPTAVIYLSTPETEEDIKDIKENILKEYRIDLDDLSND